MTPPLVRASAVLVDEERIAAERLLADTLLEEAPDANALALRRVLAGWVLRRS